MKHETLFETLIARARELGAHKASVIRSEELSLETSFRDACASNACGMYGKCYMCPPDVGDIQILMEQLAQFDYALVYQTVSELDDSFDFEGMIAAKKRFYPVSQKLRPVFEDLKITKVLHLGAGGCGICNTCAKLTEEPCRHPELAMASLEAYGVNVSKLAAAANMRYINGQNTVTYFGMVLFSVDTE